MKIMAWNVEGRLSRQTTRRRGTPQAILRRIEQLDADVGVLTESHVGAPCNGVNDRLEELGYQWHDIDYHDKGSTSEKTGAMRVISRLGAVAVAAARWGDVRNMLVVDVVDPASQIPVRLIPTHLVSSSAEDRLAQMDDIIPYINSCDQPTIMMGDFNEMHGEDLRSRIIGSRAVHMIADCMPTRIKRVAQQWIDMTGGKALARLGNETDLRDADPRHRCTETPKMQAFEAWMPSVRLAQLDHMFISPNIQVAHFAIGRDGGSDHRDISAKCTINPAA
jgi:endonuclease/exonuclease/phosphatase family metal-dependent hydrolase